MLLRNIWWEQSDVSHEAALTDRIYFLHVQFLVLVFNTIDLKKKISPKKIEKCDISPSESFCIIASFPLWKLVLLSARL